MEAYSCATPAADFRKCGGVEANICTTLARGSDVNSPAVATRSPHQVARRGR